MLAAFQQRFRWLAVDEYQDINLAQYRLLSLLASPQANLCVIGDPDQAIYGFRGASRDYFFHFQEDFPGARTISLYQNYRSTQLILDASGQVISCSPGRPPFDLRSDIVDPARLVVYQAPTAQAEADYTNSTISLLTSTAFLLTYPNCSKQIEVDYLGSHKYNFNPAEGRDVT